MILPTIAIWVWSGGSVVGIATWLVPNLIVATAVAVEPTALSLLVLTIIIVIPVGGGLFPPIGRAHGWYTDRVSRWVVDRTLAMPDRSASEALARALQRKHIRAAPSRDADTVEARGRDLRKHATMVRDLPMPDLGWQRLAREFASALDLYAGMIEGMRPFDESEARAALSTGQDHWRDLLRSRSRGYRLLTHRFVSAMDAHDNVGEGS